MVRKVSEFVSGKSESALAIAFALISWPRKLQFKKLQNVVVGLEKPAGSEDSASPPGGFSKGSVAVCNKPGEEQEEGEAFC